MKNINSTYFYDKSRILPVAISDSASTVKAINGEYGAEIFPEWLYDYIDRDKFDIDYKHDLIFNENGAVANAYDLRKYSEEEKINIKAEILMEYAEKYPEYEFVIMPGEFPMDCYKGFNSSDVLYIKDYKKHLVDDKEIKLK